MLSAYRSSILWFITVTGFLFLGFYFTYFSRFPSFDGLNWSHHFHGILFFLWMFMMIAQPLLIINKKVEWHRLLGKVSYLIMPLLLVSLHLMTKSSYAKTLAAEDLDHALAAISLSMPVIPILALHYILAIKNHKYTPHHMRYMIGISILLLGPGIGRAIIVLGQVPFPVGVSITNVLSVSICLILLIREYVTTKIYTPYLITLLSTILLTLCWESRMGQVWLFIANIYKNLFL